MSEFNPDEIDEWAVDLVVKEGVQMNLNYSEKVVAVGRMTRKKMRGAEITARLRINDRELNTLVQQSGRLRERKKQDA